jgi:hypothetical protein
MQVIVSLAILVVFLVLLRNVGGEEFITTNIITAVAVLVLLLVLFRIGFRWLTRNVRHFD